jgi:hypothetical protein
MLSRIDSPRPVPDRARPRGAWSPLREARQNILFIEMTPFEEINQVRRISKSVTQSLITRSGQRPPDLFLMTVSK